MNQQIQQVINGKRRWTIIQGDCLQQGRHVDDDSVDLVLCDPPYGMKYQGLNSKQPKIINDDRPFIWWLYDAFRVTKNPGSIVCFCTWRMQEDFRRSIELAGYHVASQLIWDKGRPGMGNTACTFAPRHEIAWFATKGRFRFRDGRPSSVLPCPLVPSRRRYHSTQKPIDLLERMIKYLVPPGGLVYDPTCGSGSTGVAALACGRRFVGIEMDPVNITNARHRLRQAARGNAGDVRAKLARPIHYQLAEVA